jgi:hypothetical protein
LKENAPLAFQNVYSIFTYTIIIIIILTRQLQAIPLEKRKCGRAAHVQLSRAQGSIHLLSCLNLYKRKTKGVPAQGAGQPFFSLLIIDGNWTCFQESRTSGCSLSKLPFLFFPKRKFFSIFERNEYSDIRATADIE